MKQRLAESARRARGVLALVSVLIGVAALACGEAEREPEASPAPAAAEAAPPQPPAPAATAATFVGSAACGECHVEIAERWRASDHARAMQKATPETVLGKFCSAPFRDGPVSWKFQQADGFRVRSEGEEKGEYQVAYAIGVDPLQQYLIAFPDGRLQALHVAWDARPTEAGGQRWFSLDGVRVPAGDPAHWKSPAVSWNAACADCHTTGFRKGFDVAANRYDSKWRRRAWAARRVTARARATSSGRARARRDRATAASKRRCGARRDPPPRSRGRVARWIRAPRVTRSARGSPSSRARAASCSTTTSPRSSTARCITTTGRSPR